MYATDFLAGTWEFGVIGDFVSIAGDGVGKDDLWESIEVKGSVSAHSETGRTF